MSKGIREGTKITFSDGNEREVFPVSIRNLRRVMKTMKSVDDTADMNDDNITVMLDAARIILEKKLRNAGHNEQENETYKTKKREEFLEANPDDEEGAWEIEDPLEDLLDIATVNKVLSAGMGTDPNE